MAAATPYSTPQQKCPDLSLPRKERQAKNWPSWETGPFFKQVTASVWTPLQTSLVSALSPLSPPPSLLCFLLLPLFCFSRQPSHSVQIATLWPEGVFGGRCGIEDKLFLTSETFFELAIPKDQIHGGAPEKESAGRLFQWFPRETEFHAGPFLCTSALNERSNWMLRKINFLF